MINGRPTMQPLPVRRVGALMHFGGLLPTGSPVNGFFLDYDGYWVTCSENVFRTIGSPTSGASIAQSWLFTLYEYLWGSYTNTDAPLLTSTGAPSGRGTSALNDWNANRRLTFPDYRGRAIIAVGQGAGLTARTPGNFVGAETHTLTIEQIPPHNHAITGGFFQSASGGNVSLQTIAGNTINLNQPTSQGNGQAHNNMQPSIALPLFISAGAR